MRGLLQAEERRIPRTDDRRDPKASRRDAERGGAAPQATSGAAHAWAGRADRGVDEIADEQTAPPADPGNQASRPGTGRAGSGGGGSTVLRAFWNIRAFRNSGRSRREWRASGRNRREWRASVRN